MTNPSPPRVQVLMIGIIAALALGALTSPHVAPTPERLRASGHPMEYYLSLPRGWKAGKKWPVVLVIENANRDFASTAAAFDRARGDHPFILVTPMVLTNGGPRVRDIPSYKYSAGTWARIEKEGAWRFDEQGIQRVLSDVRRKYGGADRAFVTGWEAGGHTVFALVFKHPGLFAAAAPVCPNYAGRWIDPATNSRAGIPIRCFVGAKDALWDRFSSQWENAKTEARRRGFSDLSTQRAIGKGHEPLAAEVLAWFDGMGQ